jgi:hypothetical protein
VERNEQGAERELGRMEHDSDRLGDHIARAREDWEAKERDPAVPGAQPEAGEEEEPMAGAQTDPERVREEGGP